MAKIIITHGGAYGLSNQHTFESMFFRNRRRKVSFKTSVSYSDAVYISILRLLEKIFTENENVLS